MENVIKDRLRQLLHSYADKTASAEEEEELFMLLRDDLTEARTKEVMMEMITGDEVYSTLDEQTANRILGNIFREAQEQKQRRIFPFKWAAAAAIILGVLIGSYFIFMPKTEKPGIARTPVSATKDIAPGGNKAVLTLADGSTVVLDSANNGALAVHANTQIVKGNGTLAYNEKQHVGIAQNTLYNSVSTPKGGQYQVTLADGSKVWLNAASSIRFPTAFTGNTRVVEITGEAYFEVAHDASKPFIVSVNDMQVEVLGTHFNINSYADEGSMKTTLLERKVRVTRNGNIAVLKPGEQSVTSLTTDRSPLTIDHSPNLDEVMAWKNGLFHFNNGGIQEVMRQLARWYDVDVVYQGNITERKFGGEISRKSNLSQALKVLEESNIHFSLEGKKLIVKP